MKQKISKTQPEFQAKTVITDQSLLIINQSLFIETVVCFKIFKSCPFTKETPENSA